jgi:hypothetical protein
MSPVRYELVFYIQKTTFFIVTAVKSSNLTKYNLAGPCSGEEIILRRSMNWVFISQKTTFFIVTAVKASNLT